MNTKDKETKTKALSVECPYCSAKPKESCVDWKERKRQPHIARIWATMPGKKKANETVGKLNSIIKQLWKLRREVCCYAPPGSDKVCDCKHLEPDDQRFGRKIEGEYTGCCEIRNAIAILEKVKRITMVGIVIGLGLLFLPSCVCGPGTKYRDYSEYWMAQHPEAQNLYHYHPYVPGSGTSTYLGHGKTLYSYPSGNYDIF